MSEYTPSQAEGESDADAAAAEQPPRTTPSQAEGEDTSDGDTGDEDADDEDAGRQEMTGPVAEDPDPGRDAPQRAEQARRGGRPGISQHFREEPRTPIQEEFDR
ncbi:hypothetical protein GCM10010503_17580 [Streptomyces lucensis JCM 4490]|uniref:Uncharacterized protein n=1 Tax=Streptomyces lucensis JCM 4490 TaxID=1306176 RepID=A0A918MPL5_9ACTN|nr:hypothetical protein [Streptomyces lucensis]GGW41823.1 hypothetical protein GCM10010503_17580 [Streptomyces lucensis JCM 4490]